jgi:hypothetical protein
MRRVSRLLIRVGILSVWVVASLGIALGQSSPVANPSSPSRQTGRSITDSRALAEAILQQRVPLNTPATVTESSVVQHEPRFPRRRIRRNVFLGVPAILAVLGAIAVAMGLRAVLAGRRLRVTLGRNIAQECHVVYPIGVPKAGKCSGVVAESGMDSESSREDGLVTSRR